MKKFNYPVLRMSKLGALLIMFMAIFLLTSCEKEEAMTLAPNDAEMAIFELLQVSADEDTFNARRKGAPAKGDDPIAALAIAGGFTQLVDALFYVDEELDAGLVDLFLNGTDQYTVFAPTDEAFEALYGVLKVDGVRNLPAELVRNVLLYHVTEGRRASNSVVPPVRPRNIETLLGVSFSVNSEGQITAVGNSAGIVSPDISASNGIIHVLDSVLLPIVP